MTHANSTITIRKRAKFLGIGLPFTTGELEVGARGLRLVGAALWVEALWPEVLAIEADASLSGAIEIRLDRRPPLRLDRDWGRQEPGLLRLLQACHRGEAAEGIGNWLDRAAQSGSSAPSGPPAPAADVAVGLAP